ncbi:MAG: phasin family protein, partial [Rhizobiaceae bacterium]
MTQSFDEAGKVGKEFLDNGLKSFASLSTGTQGIVAEAGDYSKKVFETGAAALEKLMS